MIAAATARAILVAHEQIERLETLWSAVADGPPDARIAVPSGILRRDFEIGRDDLSAIRKDRLDVRRAELRALNQQAAEEAKS